jgi:hypothetical protein
MRKLLLSVVAALAAISGMLIGTDVSPAGALLGYDGSVSVADYPDPVVPATGATVYRIVAKAEQGILPLGATLRVTVTGGGKVDPAGSQAPGCSLPSSTTVDPVFTCSVAATTGNDDVKNVAVTSLAPGVVTLAAEIEYDALDTIVDDNPSNDADTESTTYTNTPSTAGSASYLKQGESLSFKTHSVTVKTSTTGVIVKLSDAPAAGRTCGTNALCADGLRIEFPLNEIYTASNIKVDLNFGKGEACRSITNGSCTDSLWYVGPSGGSPAPVANCTSTTENVAPVPVPCVRSMYKSPSGQLHIVAGMNSTDPDLLPSGLRLT